MCCFSFLGDTDDIFENGLDDKEEGSIVDRLLADVRSGFQHNEIQSFSLQRVSKVTLNSGGENDADSFKRRGFGRRSLKNRRKQQELEQNADYADSESTCSSQDDNDSRRSFALNSKDDSLMNILINAETKSTEPQFERFGSLRRKRQQRREDRGVSDILDRERAQSPSVEQKPLPGNIMRSRTPTGERPKSGDFEDIAPSRPVRRSRSLIDKSTRLGVDNTQNSEKDTDDILNRVRRKLQDRRGNNSPDTTQTVPLVTDTNNNKDNEQTPRWRNNIGLPIIDEKQRLETPTRELIEKHDENENGTENNSLDKTKDRLARRFSGSIDKEHINKILQNGESLDNDKDNVSFSQKIQLNRRWHSDLGDAGTIDKVLKDIEESERHGKHVSRSKSCAESTTDSIKSLEDNDESEANLQRRRSKRKQRANVSLDDVKAALKPKESENTILENTPSIENENRKHNTVHTPVTPAVPPRAFGAIEERSPEKEKEQGNLSKAAKLAGKRRFRHERFGDKDKVISDEEDGRWKSDVQREEVDQALKDMAKSTMSRSKSYDESVARKALGEGGLSISGSGDQKQTFRGSVGRLGSDGRRNCVYIPSSDSDGEMIPDGTSSPKRPSSYKSDSPKSSSRLSIKSTSTSTETLRCDTPYSDESSSESHRKNSSQDMLDSPESLSKRSSVNGDYGASEPVAPPRARRPKSVYDNPDDPINHDTTTIPSPSLAADLFEEENPMTIMSMWKKKRENSRRRTSYYDNVQEMDTPTSPRNTHGDSSFTNNSRLNPSIIHKHENSSDSLRNEIGSRCSYASSSDSARDEGFETMSGTISQRTSMSSNLDGELNLNLGKKPGEAHYIPSPNTTIPDPIIPLPKQEIVVNRVEKQKELAARKQRTESWTESVCLNKDASLDSSIDYSATSPDSGHGTSKEDVWSENIDLETTIIKDNQIIKTTTPSGAPLAIAETSEFRLEKKKSVPSYMRGTSSSSTRKSVSNSAELKKTPTNVKKGTVKSIKNAALSKSRTDSNASLASVASTTDLHFQNSGKANPQRKSTTALNNSSSRSTTPHPPSSSRSVTPHSTSLSRSTTPHPTSRPTTPLDTPSRPRSASTLNKGLNRTHSLRVPNISSTLDKKRTPSTGNTPETPQTKRRSFMSPTASSKARLDGAASPTPPAPPPRTASTGAPTSTGNVIRGSPATRASAAATSIGNVIRGSPATRASAAATKTRAPAPPTPKAKDDSTVKLASENVPDVSPLKRYGSLRVASRSSTGTPIDSKERARTIMNKISSSRIKPETNDKSKGLAPVQETSEANEGKSSSFLKRIVNKASPKKVTDSKTTTLKRK